MTFFTNPEWHERAKVPFFQKAISYAATHADVLVSVSDFTASLMREILGQTAPIVVAPHGVDHLRFNLDATADDDVLVESRISTTTPYVLFVGTVEPRKGLDVLLAAFAEVAACDNEIELWIAGQAGWGTTSIDLAIATHPYAERIKRLGFVAEAVLPALYRRARAVAYPSRGEGFGLPVLEALACGAHVVTSQDTVMAEVAGEQATLVPIGDNVELANAILRSLDAPSTADDRLRRSQQALGFTWEYSVQRHLEAYELAMK
jgi:glycosyltransferase involved in cell wall biosynthesis